MHVNTAGRRHLREIFLHYSIINYAVVKIKVSQEEGASDDTRLHELVVILSSHPSDQPYKSAEPVAGCLGLLMFIRV